MCYCDHREYFGNECENCLDCNDLVDGICKCGCCESCCYCCCEHDTYSTSTYYTSPQQQTMTDTNQTSNYGYGLYHSGRGYVYEHSYTWM